MEAVRATAQNLERAMTFTWPEVQGMARDIAARRQHHGLTSVYGIPRGGIPVACMVASYLNVPIVSEPDIRETLVVDDIVDSGQTLEPYVRQGYMVDVLVRKGPSHFLVLEHRPKVDGWIVFPWEEQQDEGQGPEQNIVRLLQFIGEDPTRNGLKETPKRVLKAWKDMTAGYKQDPKLILGKVFEDEHDELIILKGIEFHSTCEHHLLPFYGTASIGYIPRKSVVGISKLARLVECFARRLQIQERLTRDIAEAIKTILDPQGVGVVMKAKHSCMGCRGVQKPDSDMITSVTLGILREDYKARSEFMSLISI